MLRPSRRQASFLACTLIASAVVLVARAGGVGRAELPVARRVLDNGMTVVIAPDPRVSSVHVALRFEGGAGDEAPDQAGYTRLVEGLFADGTVHTKASEHEQRIEAAGGWTASQTTLDELVLSTEVPPEALELALWLDAERMAGLADAITAEHVAKEREAMAAAYHAAYVEEPYALVTRALRGALWPAGSANRHDVLGEPEVLARASVASVRAFVRERIQPARATLVIAGAVSAHDAAELAQRYFQWIPRRDRERATTTTLGALQSPAQIHVRDPVEQIAIAYRLPASADQHVQLEVLARVIAGDPISLLSIFVDGKRATEIRAEVVWHARGAELVIHVTPSADLDRQSVRQLAEAVRRSIGALSETTPPQQLVARAGAAWLVERLLVLESLTGRAATYPEWSNYDSIDQYVRDLVTRVQAVHFEDMSTLARTWLAPASAVVVIGMPEAPRP